MSSISKSPDDVKRFQVEQSELMKNMGEKIAAYKKNAIGPEEKAIIQEIQDGYN